MKKNYIFLFVVFAILFSGCSFKKVGAKKSSDIVYEEPKKGKKGDRPFLKTNSLLNKKVDNSNVNRVQRTKFYPDGTYYEGDLVSGLRHGYGKTIWSDGTTYIGEYKNDLEHGIGVVTMPNGKKIKSRFYEGKQVE